MSIWNYWGKADDETAKAQGVSCHLAALHMLDVAAVAVRLIERSPLLCGRLARMLGLPDEQVAPTIGAFVALHDFGKIDARFQAKALDAARALSPAWKRLPQRLGAGFDHGSAGFGHLRRDLNDTVERDLGENAWPLLQAVTGHHGEIPGRRDACDAARFSDDHWREEARLDRAARADWLHMLVDLFRGRGAKLPLTIDPGSPPVVLIAGLCSVADWIGSNVDFFPYVAEPRPIAQYFEDHALPRAQNALNELALRSARPSGRDFHGLFGFAPRDVQEVTEALTLPRSPCLIIVEAQMGKGKTEAALALAKRFLAQGDATGLYFALPTMATSNAMLERLERDLPKMFDGSVNLVLSHGRRERNQGFQRIKARGGPGSGPYEDEATVVCNRWLLGRKRALLGQVGVGTIDQAMLAALRVRHHFVRTYALAESVVILDEIHAYDAYMSVILDRLIEWLGALGAPVILLSATLPATKRAAFVEAYARGAGITLPTDAPAPAAEAAYPLVTCVSANGTKTTSLAAAPKSTPVELEVIATDEPEATVLPRLVAAVRGGAMVTWIRNTVTDAQRAWDAASDSGVEKILFHARMRACDRAGVEEQVLARFGKDGTRGGMLLIATQVVEQSLDLDFDLLVTDLAPVDLVLQRAGRLHRHERGRPAGFKAPRLLVVAPGPDAAAGLDFGGSGCVYDRATLGLTLRLLAGRRPLTIPGDIRALVEALYDPPSRQALIDGAANTAKLRAAEATGKKALETKRNDAKRACIPPAHFDPAAAETYRDDDEESVQAFTRDGDSTALLPVLWNGDGQGGRALEGGDPWQLDPKSPHAWEVACALAEQLVNVPAYPWQRIERGSRARGEPREWEAWEERAKDFLRAMHMDAVLVPMRDAGDGGCRGSVQTQQGKSRRLAYSRSKGLWFLDS